METGKVNSANHGDPPQTESDETPTADQKEPADSSSENPDLQTRWINMNLEAGNLRQCSSNLRTNLRKLRERVGKFRTNIAESHAIQQELLLNRIVWLQRELGSVDLHKHFSDDELTSLIAYVHQNPYLSSLLEKRNSRLLNNLLTCQTTSPEVAPMDVVVVEPEPDVASSRAGFVEKNLAEENLTSDGALGDRKVLEQADDAL